MEVTNRVVNASPGAETVVPNHEEDSMERSEIDNLADQGESIMAAFCENAQLFGATPGPDEFDSRDVWDEEDAIYSVRAAFEILADSIGPDGTQLADERESVLWGFVNMLDAFAYHRAQKCARMDGSTINKGLKPLVPRRRPVMRTSVCASISSLVLNLELNFSCAVS